MSLYSRAPGPSSSENSLRSGNRQRHRSGSPPRNSGTDPAGELAQPSDRGSTLRRSLRLCSRGTPLVVLPPIRRIYMCSRSVFPIFLVIQWSPHPGPGFPTFAGIFEFAIRYFALERCFPLSAGTLFILLSLEVPRYQDTPSAQVLTGIIRSPLSKNLQRVLLRRDPFRHQPLPHLVFCFTSC